MIRKSVKRFSLATNATHLRGDHAQSKTWSAMTPSRARRDAVQACAFSPQATIFYHSLDWGHSAPPIGRIL
jgi:hypothetical protein